MNDLRIFLEHILSRRPGALDLLHRIGLVRAMTQTRTDELAALERYAAGARKALEIGTYQGVSAACIARVLATDGSLYCVDPWPDANGRLNRCFLICKRHLRRRGVESKIRFIRSYSHEAQKHVPDNLDFAFIDGDHSWDGIETDWRIVSAKLRPGSVVCLHDSVVPAGEESRDEPSCHYFSDVILQDSRFALVEIVHSMAILRKL